MALRSNGPARRHAGQPPTAPFCQRQTSGLTCGGFTPTRGRGLPFVLCSNLVDFPGSGAPLGASKWRAS